MNDEQLVKDAAAAIGAGQGDDFGLTPRKHADAIDAKAAALSGILRGSQLSNAAGQYEEKDIAAIEAETAFKSVATRANWVVFLTTCLSAALLIVSPLVPGSNWLLVTLGC